MNLLYWRAHSCKIWMFASLFPHWWRKASVLKTLYVFWIPFIYLFIYLFNFFLLHRKRKLWFAFFVLSLKINLNFWYCIYSKHCWPIGKLNWKKYSSLRYDKTNTSTFLIKTSQLKASAQTLSNYKIAITCKDYSNMALEMAEKRGDSSYHLFLAFKHFYV